jgi:hypothetical protein
MSLPTIFHNLLSHFWPAVFSVLVVLGFFVSILRRQILNRIREYRASTWPIVGGLITTTSVRVIRADRGELAFAEIGYSYQIEGNYCSGYFKVQFPDEQAAWTFVDKLKGQPAVIRYNPRKPDVSILRTQDQGPGFKTDSLAGFSLRRAL